MLDTPLRILIVDDEPAILRTLTQVLSLRGFECAAETDPLEALRRAAAEDFQLVITDAVMPSMDGLEFVRRVRESGFLGDVVVMTAFNTLDRAVEARELGVVDYLLKPFESLGQVEEVVAQAHARFKRWRTAIIDAVEERDPG